MADIHEIVKDNFKLFPQDITNIELSNSDEDTKESFDLVYKSKVEVSVRIRKYEYLIKYSDFTIRSRSRFGGKTEIDKLIAGKGNIYLYAWKNKDSTKLYAWILVDINKLRPLFTDFPAVQDIPNGDGTYFRAYKISTILAYDALINNYNIPITYNIF